MRDQYGNAVPADLVVIPNAEELTLDEIEIIDDMDWYECEGFLLVPQNEIGGDDPRDAGLKVDQDGNLIGEVMKVDQCLHRYNDEYGFYHA
jgi:hypothetical protein